MKDELLRIVLMLPAILVAITFHEYAHAKVAVMLGDETPKYQGRLTLNPFSHIDFLGFLMMIIIGFGWAKPVQTNPSALKNYYKDDLKISIAGPLANLLCSIIFMLLLVVVIKLPIKNEDLHLILNTIVYRVSYYNCLWMFLNLIPIPGFDGFHIIRDLFPKQFLKIPNQFYRYQNIIFILLIIPIFGGKSIFSFIVGYPTEIVMEAISKLAFSIL
ncbi:site-2 protease family protein [Clostridium senegalense]|uniref:Site-2 protease family protein n=1 Tax=Clostridium senegalense TaxID=1465809 RepID=A0A6M0H5B6_9CLOT|nr:site-2 protease family protein [Clostridium senegalense]NEU04772.1 site-2 protease family protein [Clostridium senegalense]